MRYELVSRRSAALFDDVECRHAIRLGHGWEVEDIVDIGIDIEFSREAELSDMHEFGGVIAGDLHTDYAPAGSVGNQLEQAPWRSVDLSAGNLIETSATD